jgi:exodeoxyribonuclease III
MLRVASFNLNGIRSATSKGFAQWAQRQALDCLGVQELKAQADDMVGRFDTLSGLRGSFCHATKKGYSGVGLYSRIQPYEVLQGFDGGEFDAEGRYIEHRDQLPGGGDGNSPRTSKPGLSIVSAYFPSGSSGEERQAAKYRFLDLFYAHITALAREREVLLMGDINIAHQAIDLKNARGNTKNSGFLPEERAWMTRLLSEGGFVDVFRTLNPHPDQYTWWSNRGQARANNVGWRIDYHLATPAIAALARHEEIYTAERFSDHAPLVIDYDLDLA